MNKADRIKELETRINQAKHDYYNASAKVSDAIFDAWYAELKALDPKNKAITTIGAPVAPSEWKKYSHSIPMMSLHKVNTPDELNSWAKDKSLAPNFCTCMMTPCTHTKSQNSQWFVCEKLDGLSINCVYEGGKLVAGATRGSGDIGDLITSNVRRMQGVVLDLKTDFTGSIRGEIVMLRSIHQKHFAGSSNPRNLASGTSKRLDGSNSDKLNVIFYQVLGDIDFKTEVEQFVWLKKHGMDTPNHWSFNAIDQANKHWRTYQDKDRAKLDYDIDGLVVRLNDLSEQMALGSSSSRPLGAIAFKFDNEARESILRDIMWQCGNSGRQTPVAIIDPVVLVGASVSRASLYNIAYIQELGVDIGATVLAVRCNDVIPALKEVIKGTGTVAKAPKTCVSCGSKLEMDGENLMCRNTLGCPAMRSGRIKNWISELNILDIGDTLIDRLVETGKVSTVADLYKLTVSDLASIDRMGQKSAQKCFDNLWKSKEIPLEVFLGGLSIPMIGQSTIKAIMNAGCDTLEKFGKLGASQFENVPGVGPSKAKSLADGLKTYQPVILEILKLGVKVKEKIVGTLSGKSFCFTGTMQNKRAVLEKMVADAGGEVKNGVGKGLSALVIADPQNSSSSKAVSARKLGVALISEVELLDLLK